MKKIAGEKFPEPKSGQQKEKHQAGASDTFPIGAGSDCDRAASDTNPINYYREIVTYAPEIAVHVKKTTRTVFRLLNELFSAGLVERVGKRGGWLVRESSPPPPAAAAAPVTSDSAPRQSPPGGSAQ